MEQLVNSLEDFFISLESPILQAFVGGLFTWILTALGASLVFFFKSANRKLLDAALGFTGGVMIAASFWSLLSPAIAAVERQHELGLTSLPSFLPPAIGFFLGAFFLYFLDKKMPHLHLFKKIEEAEGPKTDLKKKTRLAPSAVKIHVNNPPTKACKIGLSNEIKKSSKAFTNCSILNLCENNKSKKKLYEKIIYLYN